MKSVGVFFIFTLKFIVSVQCENGTYECSRLREKCVDTESCCLGTCLHGACNDGLYKNKRDRSSGSSGGSIDEISQLIEAELYTGENVDISDHPNTVLLPSLKECGFSTPNNFNNDTNYRRRRKRIVGGKSYELGKYPWAVSLHVNEVTEGKSEFQCGGTLINTKYVLTAAHCVTRLRTGGMLKWVTLGNVDRRWKLACDSDSNMTTFQTACDGDRYLDVEIDEWIVHESYSESNVRNDIALIKLKKDVEYTDYIRPICLPWSENILKDWADATFTVVGWGKQNDASDQGPTKLSYKAQEVETYLVHRSNCDRFFTRVIGQLRKSQICAGGYPGKGDCNGDSGGPLFRSVAIPLTDDSKSDVSIAERYFLFGVVSTGPVNGCAREGKPSVYTNVLYYMNWILDNLNVVAQAKPKNAPMTRLKANPVEEFETGRETPINVMNHPHKSLLPQFPNCGQIWTHSKVDDINTQGNGSSRVKRVVGGISQRVASFPWMAQIYARHVVSGNPVFRCGGFLINSRMVVTSAHCVIDMRGPIVLDGVILGNTNRNERNECVNSGTVCSEQKMFPIEEIIPHEGFAKFSRENDIAMIKLGMDVPYNQFIQPICLPLTEDIVSLAWPNSETDRRYIAAGWGRVTPDSAESSTSNLLIAANFILESKKYCETTLLRKRGKLEHSRICGGSGIPGRGECFGDTGGPMMRWVTLQGPNGNETRMFSFGVLSVAECANQGVPSIYQNILYYMPWIMDHLND